VRQQRMNFRLLALLLMGLFALLAMYGGFSVIMYGSRWVAHRGNTRQLNDAALRGDVLDRNGVVLATTTADGTRAYQTDESSRRAVVHLLGDEKKNVANGVESFKASYLLGFESTLAERLVQTLNGEDRKGDSLILTADSRLCTTIMKAFPSGTAGAAVVMNYKTGEVLGMVSLPTFDPNNEDAVSEDDPNTPFWNRVTQAKYPPGSTFKIITMASALMNLPDITTRTLFCTGQLQVLNDVITDFGDAVHHEKTLTQAFTVSCNNIFASIALELGDEHLRKTAEAFGFNDNFLFRDLVVENSVYPTTGRDKVQIAWSGAGQGNVETTPLHMCMVAAAVANGGVMMEPGLIKDVENESGTTRKEYTPKVYRRAIPEDIAKSMKSAMHNVTTSGTGVNAQVEGLTVCGKTGSAEARLDGQDVVHGWYVGFLDEPDLPYAVSVIVERGESGSGAAAPIAKKIFQYLKDNYR